MKKIKTLVAALTLLAITAPVLAQNDRPAPRSETTRGERDGGHRPPPPRGGEPGEMGPPLDRENQDMRDGMGDREGGDRDGKSRFGRFDPPLREDQTQEALEVLAAFDPEAAAQLTEMVKEDPDKARNLIVRRVPFIARLLQLKKDDPQGFDLRASDYRLDKQARDLAVKYRELDAADNRIEAKDTLRQLENVVEAHFKVRQEMREHILKKMEERLEEMRKSLKERDDDRRDLVAQRVDELVTDKAEYRW